MSGEVFTDTAMLEIFRAEVETHVESLTAGLLALERDPGDTSRIDEMMRAAHSIKGAARIVGVEPAVRVAHVMEDGFIAAQNGKLTLRPEHVDALLRGVDMLGRVANSTKDAGVDWRLFEAELKPLVAEITAVLAEMPASVSASSSAQQPVATTPARDVTIQLPAVLDAAAAETARREFVAALDAKSPVIRFDLSLTNDLDATGLALLAAVPNCVSGATRVELAGSRSELQVVFQATGIDRLYPTGGR